MMYTLRHIAMVRESGECFCFVDVMATFRIRPFSPPFFLGGGGAIHSVPMQPTPKK